MNWRKLTLVACVGGLCFTLSAWASISISKLTKPQQPITQLSVKQLQEKAQAITVKVISPDVLGSGILLQRQDTVYTVITNAHVLRSGKLPYRIQTADGRIWSANILKTNNFGKNDLAILQFHSTETVYPVASLGSFPVVGDAVFAAGFPITEQPSGKTGFVLTSGKVSLILPQALEGGYQIGYTNDIQKGMSGGALLNSQGEVVGVNGMHAFPLWDAPSMFVDGSEADLALQQKINRLSWAVPIKTVLTIQNSKFKIQNSKLKTVGVGDLSPLIYDKPDWRINNEILSSTNTSINWIHYRPCATASGYGAIAN